MAERGREGEEAQGSARKCYFANLAIRISWKDPRMVQVVVGGHNADKETSHGLAGPECKNRTVAKAFHSQRFPTSFFKAEFLVSEVMISL